MRPGPSWDETIWAQIWLHSIGRFWRRFHSFQPCTLEQQHLHTKVPFHLRAKQILLGAIAELPGSRGSPEEIVWNLLKLNIQFSIGPRRHRPRRKGGEMKQNFSRICFCKKRRGVWKKGGGGLKSVAFAFRGYICLRRGAALQKASEGTSCPGKSANPTDGCTEGNGKTLSTHKQQELQLPKLPGNCDLFAEIFN